MSLHSYEAPAVAEHRGDKGGTVVAPHALAVDAGMKMYELGGNAVDAAVAAALVSGVIEPTETSLAGSGFMLVAGEQGPPIEVDFGPKAPVGAHPDMFELETNSDGLPSVLGLAPVVDNANVDGPLAAGVPRTLSGLVAAHEKYGNLPRGEVLAPPIAAARDGFAVDAWFLTSALSDLDRLRRDATARRIFLDEKGLPIGAATSAGYGASFGEYARVRQEQLAQTLELVAEWGLDSLLHGDIAHALVESSHEAGGLLTVEDLAASGPYIGEARLLAYRDATIAASHAPSGALTSLEALAIFQQAVPHYESISRGERLRSVALSLRYAFADRYHWLGDPDAAHPPVDEMLSREYAAAIADYVRNGYDVPRWHENEPWVTYASHAVNDPRHIVEGHPAGSPWTPSTATTPTSGTTHISAADADGTVVAITHTAANHFGNGIVCPRTGLLFDSSMAWFNAAPGAANSITSSGRALANMGPVLVLHGDGARSAVGSSGGRRIISAVSQLVMALVDERASAKNAIARPRIDGSARQLVVPELLEQDARELEGIDTQVIHHSNDPFPMDFSRPNIARYLGNSATESAIAAAHYTA